MAAVVTHILILIAYCVAPVQGPDHPIETKLNPLELKEYYMAARIAELSRQLFTKYTNPNGYRVNERPAGNDSNKLTV